MAQGSKSNTTRRSALGAATGLATSTFAAPTIVRAATRRALDFNDPEDQLYALVKMTGDCPSSKQMGLLSVFHKGGSGSSLFDVKPLGVDGSSGGFGWSVF